MWFGAFVDKAQPDIQQSQKLTFKPEFLGLGGNKKKKKISENDQFQSFFF